MDQFSRGVATAMFAASSSAVDRTWQRAWAHISSWRKTVTLDGFLCSVVSFQCLV